MVLELRHIKYNYKVLNISIYIDSKQREDSENEQLVFKNGKLLQLDKKGLT